VRQLGDFIRFGLPRPKSPKLRLWPSIVHHVAKAVERAIETTARLRNRTEIGIGDLTPIA